GFLHSGTRACN
ncbi:small GTP-binding domain protein, partial [Escherichia coli 95.1288]